MDMRREYRAAWQKSSKVNARKEPGVVSSLRSHRLAELTSPEVREAIAGGIDVALLPVGSTEQHGAHRSCPSEWCSSSLVATSPALAGLVTRRQPAA
jgi:hypothetical protein